jgi:DNA-nicking Smr family endonuclease
MIKYISNRKAEIDIHSMTRSEAKKYLERFLTSANGSVREVTVIHGYAAGTVLQQMVRGELRHRRIKSKAQSLNPGVTILYLN